MREAKSERAAAIEIVPSKVLCCAACRDGLLSHGADPVRAPRVGSLLDRCEAHTPATAEVQAMHEVWALPESVEAWRAECFVPPEREPHAITPEEVPLVAQMATRLLSGVPSATSDEIRQAVSTARAVLAFAKGIER